MTQRVLRAALLSIALLAISLPARAQGVLSALQTDVDQVTTKARASVVTVFAQNTMAVRGVRDAEPKRKLHTRVGSGVAVEDDMILTTASVVIGAERVVVRTLNGIQVDADLVGMDPIFNLALLRVPELRLPPLSFASGRPPQAGDWVIALGTSYRAQPTQSVGYVAFRFSEPRVPLLQLTNTVYPGNSGGAALNPRGELVGIVQGELASPEAYYTGADGEHRPAGMSFMLPVETVRPVYESLLKEGRVHHGYFGVSTTAASVISDTEPGLEIPIGARIESVAPGGPAERLGLKPADLVVGFDGERVEYPSQLARWVAATPPGTEVEFVWVRDEIQRVGRVALSEAREVPPAWAAESVSPSAPGSKGDRITAIERQIQRLNRELQSLRSKPPTTKP